MVMISAEFWTKALKRASESSGVRDANGLDLFFMRDRHLRSGSMG
jgi:hypothetical protein